MQVPLSSSDSASGSADSPTGLAVVGMHRSGTSATAGALHALGIEMGERFLPAQEGVNEQGFWEHLDVVDLHDRVFHWLKRDWHDVRGVPQDFPEGPDFGAAVAQARGIIRENFRDAPLWAIKDPRLSLMLPVWRQATREEGVRLKCIITLRHPFEVAGSLSRRDALTRAHGLLLWGGHLASVVRDSRGMPRTILDYSALLADWRRELERVAEELGLDWGRRISSQGSAVDAFLKTSLHRQRSSDRPVAEDALASHVFALYDAMQEQSAGGGSWAAVEDAAEAFRTISRMLVPHLHELMQHVYMHDARARNAHELVSKGLDEKGALIGRIAADLELVKKTVGAGVDQRGRIEEVFTRAQRGFDAVLEDHMSRAAENARMLHEKDSWIAELQKHADGLEGRRSELEGQLQILRDALGQVRAGFDRALAEVEARLAVATGQVLERDRLVTTLKGHADALEADRARLKAEYAQAAQRASDELRQRDGVIEELKAHAEGLEEERARLGGECTMLEQRAAADVRQRDRAADELKAHVRGLEAERTRLESEYAALEQRTAADVLQRDGRIDELREHVEGLEQVANDLRHQLSALDAARADVRRLNDEVLDSRVLASAYADTLRRVASSRSWKMTAPVRWLGTNVRAWMGRAVRPITYRQAFDIAAMPPAPRTVERLSSSDSEASVEAIPSLPEAAAGVTLERLQRLLYGGEATDRAPEYVPAEDVAPPSKNSLRARAIAFYLPQFHPIAENNEWWGAGFTEWTNVTKAYPQFDRHYQPHLPGELGFYDLRLESVIRQQVDLARQYGIEGFCFHYYWFAGRRLLREPLDVFCESDVDYPYCLCWANENWTRRWDGHDSEVLMGQEHSEENDLAFIRDLEPHLRDPRYIRVDGRPLIIVYRPSILPDAGATLRRWRDYCRQAGIGEIFMAMVQFDLEDPRVYGFDAAMEFPPHKLAAGLPAINHQIDVLNPDYAGHVVHYQAIVDVAKDWPVPEYPMVRGVFPGWDNEARRPGRGYTFAFSTPARYREWLEHAVSYAERNPVAGERLVMINAWNEWAEGAHLEPDRRYGRAFLQATRDVLVAAPAGLTRSAEKSKRLVLVSHDAHPHGAQYLALHLARELKDGFGFKLEIVLLGDGELWSQFEQVGTVHDARGLGRQPEALAQLARTLAAGADAAIVNTTVAGHFAAALDRAGVRVVSLIHELPTLIRSYGLELEAEAIARHAHRVVFPAPQVRDGFAQFVNLDPAQALIRPQGLFVRSRHVGKTDHSGTRDALRRRLRLPRAARIVLAVGYGDARKGVDIFCEAASRVRQVDNSVHFVWVGHYDADLVGRATRTLKAEGTEDGVHFIGKEFATDDFYAGADVYALTSREDPFPSVLLESLSVGTPVLAFAGSGGADALLPRCGGYLVTEPTAEAFSNELLRVLADHEGRRSVGRCGAELVQNEYSFRQYVFDLLDLCGVNVPRVTVVVPNYNYAQLLPDRLASVFAQTLPPYEVIVLDDASTDDSNAVLDRLRDEWRADFRVVRNERNSGSVFSQWRKGAELARGEYLWIAEADDLAAAEFLETVTAMMADRSVVLGYCESSQINQSGDHLADDYRYYTDPDGTGRWNADYICSASDEMAASLAVRNTIPNVSAVVFRTAALRQVMERDFADIAGLRVAGDWLVYAKVLSGGALAYSARSLNIHRRHEDSVTSRLDGAVHLAEVERVQDTIAEIYGSDTNVRGRVASYRAQLRAHFSLPAPGVSVSGAAK